MPKHVAVLSVYNTVHLACCTNEQCWSYNQVFECKSTSLKLFTPHPHRCYMYRQSCLQFISISNYRLPAYLVLSSPSLHTLFQITRFVHLEWHTDILTHNNTHIHTHTVCKSRASCSALHMTFTCFVTNMTWHDMTWHWKLSEFDCLHVTFKHTLPNHENSNDLDVQRSWKSESWTFTASN